MFRVSSNVIKTEIFSIINTQQWFKVTETKFYSNVAKAKSHSALQYKDLSKIYRHPKKIVMQNLNDFYEIDFNKSEKTLKSFDFIKLLPLTKLSKNCQVLKEENVTVDRILRYIKVLSVPNLSEKVELIKQLPYNINDLFPLLSLRTSVIKRLLTEDVAHRIEFISRNLELPVLEVCNLLLKTPFNKMDLQTFEKRLMLLKSYGMNSEEINKDFDILKMDVNLLTQRLDKFKQHGIKNCDSAMLCKPEHRFQKIFREKLLTGGGTTREYLMKKLKLAPEQVDSLVICTPSVYKKDVELIDALINTLFSRGFTTEHIILCPRILMTSLSRVEKRLNELNNLEQRKKELYRVTANEKLYGRYFSKI